MESASGSPRESWSAALLAFTAGKPTVVSRPQFLVADVYVVAELQDGAKNKPPPLHPPAPALWGLPQPGWPTTLPVLSLLS